MDSIWDSSQVVCWTASRVRGDGYWCHSRIWWCRLGRIHMLKFIPANTMFINLWNVGGLHSLNGIFSHRNVLQWQTTAILSVSFSSILCDLVKSGPNVLNHVAPEIVSRQASIMGILRSGYASFVLRSLTRWESTQKRALPFFRTMTTFEANSLWHGLIILASMNVLSCRSIFWQLFSDYGRRFVNMVDLHQFQFDVEEYWCSPNHIRLSRRFQILFHQSVELFLLICWYITSLSTLILSH